MAGFSSHELENINHTPHLRAQFGVFDTQTGRPLTYWDVLSGTVAKELQPFVAKDALSVLHERHPDAFSPPSVTQEHTTPWSDWVSAEGLQAGLADVDDVALGCSLLQSMNRQNTRLGAADKGGLLLAVHTLAAARLGLPPVSMHGACPTLPEDAAAMLPQLMLDALSAAGPTLTHVDERFGADAAALAAQLMAHGKKPGRLSPLLIDDLTNRCSAPAGQVAMRRLEMEVRTTLTHSGHAAGAPWQALLSSTTNENHVLSPLLQNLADHLQSSSATLARDLMAGLPEALGSVLQQSGCVSADRHIDLDVVRRTLGEGAVDLVVALSSTHSTSSSSQSRQTTWTLASGVVTSQADEALADMLGHRDIDKRHQAAMAQMAKGGAGPCVGVDHVLSVLLQDAPTVTALARTLRTSDLNGVLRALHEFMGSTEVAGSQRLQREVVAFWRQRPGDDDNAADASTLPHAIVESFARLADDDGHVHFADLHRTFGPVASRLLLFLQSQPSPNVRHTAHRLTGLSQQACRAVGASRPMRDVASRMQGLRSVVQQQGASDTFDGFSATVVQHLFVPNIMPSLLSCGLQPQDLRVCGKSYSTHPDAYADLLAMGLHVDPRSVCTSADVHEDASLRLKNAAQTQLQAMFADVTLDELQNKNAKPRFLLIDEGGKLLEALHTPAFAKYAHLCVGVEHTDRGVQVLQDMQDRGIQLQCPVVNMARSQLKKLTESAAIGESVVFHTEHALATASSSIKLGPAQEVLVIGYGAVGKDTARALQRRGCRVRVLDTDEAAQKRAQDDGLVVVKDREEALAAVDMVVSATGRCTLPLDDHHLLKDGAVLVNAASGNHELGISQADPDALARMTQAESVDDKGQASVTFQHQRLQTGEYYAPGAHRHLVLHPSESTEVLVVRGGAVVNMTLGMPPEYAQLTLSLVMASAFQAKELADLPADKRPAGLVELDAHRQQSIKDAVTTALADAGVPPLETPDFRQVQPWG